MLRVKPILALILASFIGGTVALGQTSDDMKIRGLDAFFSFEGLRPNNPDQIYELNYLRDSTYIFLMNDEDQWAMDKKHVFLYDNQGRMTIDRQDSYVGGKWHPVGRVELDYNASGLLSQRLNTLWSPIEKEFENESREHFFYNLAGRVEEKLIETSNQGQWNVSEKRTFVYNSIYLKTRETIFDWDQAELDWNPISRTLYNYNDKNRVISETIQVWVDTLASWVNQFTRDFTYDNSDQLISTTRSAWNTSIGDWVGQSVVALSYNEKGQLESTEQFSLNQEETEGIESIEAEYDDNGNLDLTVFQEWNTDEDVWEPYERHVHFWSEYLTGNLFDGKEDVQCFYANPYTVGLPWYCEGLLSDEIYTLSIFDLQGRLHHRQVIRGGDTFRPGGGDLESGLYLITLSGGLTQHTEKVLVRR